MNVVAFGAGVALLSCAVIAQPISAQSVSIPLSGTMPLKCNARILSREARSQGGAQVQVQLAVEHSCNAPHVIRFESANLPTVGRMWASYDGRMPNGIGPQSLTFLQPIVQSKRSYFKLTVENAGGLDAQELANAFAVVIQAN